MGLVEDKHALRSSMRGVRDAIGPLQRKGYEDDLAERLYKLPAVRNSRVVGVYQAYGSEASLDDLVRALRLLDPSPIIAYPVMQRALTAVQRFNNQMQRKGLIETNVRKEESGDFIAELCLRDDAGILMRLELSAPTLSQARGLTRAYEKQADSIYQQMMTLLLGGSGEKHADD